MHTSTVFEALHKFRGFWGPWVPCDTDSQNLHVIQDDAHEFLLGFLAAIPNQPIKDLSGCQSTGQLFGGVTVSQVCLMSQQETKLLECF